jgi:phage-related tail protein
LVGEEGPELVNLPRGSQVSTANQTKQLLQGKGDTYNYNLKVVNNQNMSEDNLKRMFQRMERINGF